MSDAAIKDQPEVAVAATEAPSAQEATPAAAATEQTDEKMADAPVEAQNDTEKSAETTEAQVDRKEFKKNRKYDPSTQPVTDDPVKIRNQVRPN